MVVRGTSAALGTLLGDLKQNQSQIYRDILDHNLIPVHAESELPEHWGEVHLVFEGSDVKAHLMEIPGNPSPNLFTQPYRPTPEDRDLMHNLVSELRYHLSGEAARDMEYNRP